MKLSTGNATANGTTGSNTTNSSVGSNSTANDSVSSNVTVIPPRPAPKDNRIIIPALNGTDLMKTVQIMLNKTLNDPMIPRIWYGAMLEPKKPWPLGFPRFEQPPAPTHRIFPVGI